MPGLDPDFARRPTNSVKCAAKRRCDILTSAASDSQFQGPFRFTMYPRDDAAHLAILERPRRTGTPRVRGELAQAGSGLHESPGFRKPPGDSTTLLALALVHLPLR